MNIVNVSHKIDEGVRIKIGTCMGRISQRSVTLVRLCCHVPLENQTDKREQDTKVRDPI